MSIIAKYKFDQTIYENFIPEFNSGFTDYTITDEMGTDGFTIRTIESNSLPTLIRFGTTDTSGNGDYTKQYSLLEVDELNANNVNNMSFMFYRCKNLTRINTNFNTSNVTDMQYMFSNCQSLTSLDVSSFNTEKVTIMGWMFQNCSSLTSLDVSNFNVSQVMDMQSMFYDCSSLASLDLSNWNTDEMTNTYRMFNNCSSLTYLNLSNFNTEKVTSMGYMFYKCSSLTSLDVSNFNTEKVTNMSGMFNGCSSLTSLDVSNFNLSQLEINKNTLELCSQLSDIGMIYCNSSTINKIVNLLSTNTTIWYSEDEVNVEDLDVLENITYKPYKENRISYEGITLRSLPNGVKDEINVLTGEYIQRVKEMTIDGSENWELHGFQTETVMYKLYLPDGIYSNDNNFNILSNSNVFKVLNNNEDVIVEGVWIYQSYLYYRLLRTNGINTVDLLKSFLNNIKPTIYYELSESIIHQLDAQSLTPYQDGYISMEAEVNYPSFIYSLPSTNTFYIPKIKNMTQYTLKYPVGSGTVTIGNIQYNVTSDSMLFTTPIEITGDKNSLVFETDDNPTDIMILEGNYSNREVKYFTGINSVINPIIRVTNSLTGGSVEYKGNSDIALYSLPNKMSDKLDVLTGYLVRVTGIREYQDGDYELDNVFTDGINTVYKLDSPLLYRNINFPTPTLNGYGTIELDSDEAIPQFNYRTLSNNYYPIELLEPNSTYTMIGEAQANTTFTLGGTYVGNYSGGKVVINLGSVTENSLKFSNDIGLKNFMLVKGDATNSTLPFYTGIKSVEDISFLIKGYDGQENNLVLDDSIVLRECGGVYDSIDLINYTMTKRLNEIVLVGTEYWSVETSKSVDSNYQLFSLAVTSAKDTKNAKIYCDKLTHKYLGNDTDCVYFENNKLYLCINKHTIGGDNVNALKVWLTKNNVKIIYPLINEVKLDLDVVWEITPPTSYETQTEFSSNVALGSLKPMLALTVATTTLEDIVSTLETQNAKLEEENIATMLALTGIYETMVVPTIESGVSTVNLSDGKDGNNINGMSISPMGMIYAKLVKKGLKTIEQVPSHLQAEVKYVLKEDK